MKPEKLKEKWAEQDELEINAAVSALFEHGHGRRLLWWLLQVGKVGVQPFAQNSLITAFSCGELNVGQRILDRMLQVSPDGYVNLMKEMQNERSDRDGELNASYTSTRSGDEPGFDSASAD